MNTQMLFWIAITVAVLVFVTKGPVDGNILNDLPVLILGGWKTLRASKQG